MQGVGVRTESKWLESVPVCRSVQCGPLQPVFVCRTHTLYCGSQRNLSSCVGVPGGAMAMQNEFVPVAFCVLRTLEHCVTLTLFTFSQFRAQSAVFYPRPLPPHFPVPCYKIGLYTRQFV